MSRSSRVMAVALLAVLATPVFAGCFGMTSGALVVAASAPRASSGMTLFVVEQPGLIDRLREERAEYAIYYGDTLVYPLGGKGATLPIVDRQGTVFVPYNLFVVGNGEYNIVITHGGDSYRTRVVVNKWVDYVFLHPFDKGSNIRVEAALSSGTGGRPEDRILTGGEMIVELHYRGLQGDVDRTLGAFRVQTANDQTSVKIDVPRSRLDSGPGYYSFEPVFHNLEAKNNLQVKADPTMANRNPPWNWIYITR